MANVFVNEDSLSDIADAIRSKLNVQTTYKPGEMAAAIQTISGGGSSLGTKSITANGTYNASSDSLDGYSQVTVNVPNTYAAGDEGKVVSNGSLVAQTSNTVTTNDTYDTTLINSLTVNVSGGVTPTGTKQISITQNGTTTEDVTNYASAEITVNVSGGGGGTDVTIETAATKAIDCVNQIFPSRVASGHMYVAFLKNKTTSTFETDQLLGLLVFGTSSYGVGVRWRNNGFNTMAGVSNSYDARVAIGDVFETFDINYL